MMENMKTQPRLTRLLTLALLCMLTLIVMAVMPSTKAQAAQRVVDISATEVNEIRVASGEDVLVMQSNHEVPRTTVIRIIVENGAIGYKVTLEDLKIEYKTTFATDYFLRMGESSEGEIYVKGFNDLKIGGNSMTSVCRVFDKAKVRFAGSGTWDMPFTNAKSDSLIRQNFESEVTIESGTYNIGNSSSIFYQGDNSKLAINGGTINVSNNVDRSFQGDMNTSLNYYEVVMNGGKIYDKSQNGMFGRNPSSKLTINGGTLETTDITPPGSTTIIDGGSVYDAARGFGMQSGFGTVTNAAGLPVYPTKVRSLESGFQYKPLKSALINSKSFGKDLVYDGKDSGTLYLWTTELESAVFTINLPEGSSTKVQSAFDITLVHQEGKVNFYDAEIAVEERELFDVEGYLVFDNIRGTSATFKTPKVNPREGPVRFRCIDDRGVQYKVIENTDSETVTFEGLEAGKVYSFEAYIANWRLIGQSNPIKVRVFESNRDLGAVLFNDDYNGTVKDEPVADAKYSLEEGSVLPEGLNLNSDTGAITGTVTEGSGEKNFTVVETLTESGVINATVHCSMTVDQVKAAAPSMAPEVIPAYGGDPGKVYLKAMAPPEAGTIEALAGATYEYALNSVNDEPVVEKVWTAASDAFGIPIADVPQGATCTFVARFAENTKVTASDASPASASMTHKVAIMKPTIGTAVESPCENCTITSNITDVEDESTVAFGWYAAVGDTVTYTLSPCADHTFSTMQLGGETIEFGKLTLKETTAKGNSYTYTHTVKANVADIKAEVTVADKKIVKIESTTPTLSLLANDARNESPDKLAMGLKDTTKIKYVYDNGTELADQTSTWRFDTDQVFERKGGTWRFTSAEVEGQTAKFDVVVTPVKGTPKAISDFSKPVKKAGYISASELGLPENVFINFDHDVKAIPLAVGWLIPDGFGKTVGSTKLEGTLIGIPAWATMGDTVTVTITITEEKILKVVDGLSVDDKVYDGTSAATLQTDETGILLTDDKGEEIVNIAANADNAIATFKDANVGTNIGVTIEGITLSSDEVGFDPEAYVFDFGAITADITPAPVTLEAPTTKPAVYGTALKDIALEAGSAKFGEETVEGQFTWKEEGSTIPNVENQGYTAIFTPTSQNFKSNEIHTAVVITPFALTVTPDSGQSKIYGSTDPVLSYTLEHELLAGNAISGTLTREKAADAEGKNVGAYKIINKDLSAGTNYALTVKPDVPFTITHKDITPVAKAKDREYEAENKNAAVSITLQGAVTGDTVTVNTEAMTATFADDTVAADKEVTVTGYTLDGADAGNYKLTADTITTTASITKVWPKILETPDFLAIFYGQPLWTSPLVGGKAVDKTNEETVVAGHFEWVEPGVMLAAGTHQVDARFVPEDTDAYGAAIITLEVVVKPKAITVTPDADQSKIYGEADPETLSYTIADGSLVNGDTLTGALKREAGEDANTYAITNDTFASTNYAIAVAEAYFTILPKEVSVTAEAKDRSYIKDNVDAEVTLTVNGANAEDEITATYETAVFADDAVGIDKEVTVTGIALAGEKAGNYTLPEAGQTVQTQASISTATIEIKALPTVTGGLIYGDQLKNEALTLENDGVAVSKNGEESVLIDGAFSWKNPEQVLSDIGEADAVVLFTATNLEEYGTAEATVKVNVAKKPITINPEADQTKVYNSADPTSYKFSVDETTPLVGDDFLLEVLTREAGEDVGTYAYSLSTEATENTHYTMTLGSDAAKFEITKATPQALSVPELDSKTAKTITLKTVEVSDPIAIAAKAIIEYGITEGENETIWQDSPSFVDLAGSTTYKFVVRYKATNNTEASTVSEALEVTTETAGTPVETTTITGLPEGGIEGINVTSDKDEQMVNVGDTIVYTLKGNSARNTYVPYSFSVNGASLKFELKDKATRTYEATYEVTDISAPIKGEAGYVLLGDFSGDKKINIIDAQQIAQYAGLSSEEKEKYSADKIAAGNVDFNTVVNIIDAQKIAQYASDENMNF